MRLTRPLTMMATFRRDRRRHADILLDHEHRHVAVLAEAHQHLLDLGDDDRRQSLGRLVHDQKLRIGQKRARDRQHLLLAAGELTAAMVLAFGQARECLVDALDRSRRRAASRPRAARCSSTLSERHSRRPCGT